MASRIPIDPPSCITMNVKCVSPLDLATYGLVKSQFGTNLDNGIKIENARK